MFVKTSKDKCTVTIPGVCSECGCEVAPDNIGFECDEFIVCKKCNDKTERDWEDFQIEQAKEVISMNKDEICALLNGREYGEEITSEIENYLKDSNLVAVFGASDDLMEFHGAIYDEIDCYNGGMAYLTKNGLLVNKCDEDDCPYFEQIKKQAITIEALWCAEPDISWTYKTDIPHSTFEIMEDEEIYCRGIVFDMKEVVR